MRQDTPRTETEWRSDSLHATAVVGTARREYRCRIRLNAWSASAPRVTFAHRSPGADVDVCAEWTSAATGRLTGPQSLLPWYHYFRAFQLALDALTDEIAGEVSDGQRRAFEKNHDIPHPAVDGPNQVPERERVAADQRRYEP